MGISDRFRAFAAECEPSPSYLAKQRAEAAGYTVADLTASNPWACGLGFPHSVLRDVLAGLALESYDPAPLGHPAAREAVAAYYESRAWPCDPERIVLTASTSEAYAWLFALLCNRGDNVLIAQPGYPLFDFIALYSDVAVRLFALEPTEPRRPDAPSMRYDPDAIASASTPRTRAVVLVQPHNPTGALLSASEVQAITNWAASAGIALIVDEVFADYVEPPLRYTPVASNDALVFTLNGLSKTLALPGLKLGWIRIDGPETALREAMQSLEVIADTFLSVNTPIQLALPRLLEHRAAVQTPIRDRLAQNRHSIATFPDLRASAPPSSWYGLIPLPDAFDDEEAALRLIEEASVYVHPGSLFGFENRAYLVTSLLPDARTFATGLERVEALLAARRA